MDFDLTTLLGKYIICSPPFQCLWDDVQQGRQHLQPIKICSPKNTTETQGSEASIGKIISSMKRTLLMYHTIMGKKWLVAMSLPPKKSLKSTSPPGLHSHHCGKPPSCAATGHVPGSFQSSLSGNACCKHVDIVNTCKYDYLKIS